MKSRSHFDFKSTIIPAIFSVIVGICGGIPSVCAQEVAMPDSNSGNGEVLTQVLKKMRSGEKIAPSEFQDFVKAQNDGATTGLKVAEKIPDFALVDQNGNLRKFHDLTGPAGLLLVFSRSADW
jgi:hypothetical protein